MKCKYHKDGKFMVVHYANGDELSLFCSKGQEEMKQGKATICSQMRGGEL